MSVGTEPSPGYAPSYRLAMCDSWVKPIAFFLLHHWSLGGPCPNHPSLALCPLSCPLSQAWAESGLAAGHVWVSPGPRRAAVWMLLDFPGSAQSCSCLQQLAGRWPGFCLLLSEQTFSFLPPGPFSEDIKLLAHCPRLLLPAALPGTTTSGQVAEPALSSSVLPA